MATKCPQADNWAVSEFETIKTSFKWEIRNFSGGPNEPGQFIQSPTFSSGKDIKTKWCLNVYPYGYSEPNKEFVSIFLYLKESNRSEVLAKYSSTTVNSHQKINYQLKGGKGKVKIGGGWLSTRFIRRSELENPGNHLLPNDVLTIYCEITCFGKCQTTSGQNITLKRSQNKLLEDMTTLYQNTNDSDVVIVVKGYKFSAHKLILKARSSVFAAMFTHQMEENQQNKVVIDDIEKEVFSKVLRYIYTDSIVNEDIDSSFQLFMAADKYNLDDLKSICEEYIGSQLTVESVSDVLILADNHSAQELKAKAIDFIKNNSIQVMKTKGWKEVIDRSDLLQLF